MRKISLLIGLFALFLSYITTLNADTALFTMMVPISGILDILTWKEQYMSTYLVFDAQDQRVLLQTTGPNFSFSTTLSEIYRHQNRVPFLLLNGDLGFYDLQEHTSQHYPVYNPQNSKFFYAHPEGWSADGTNMLYSIYDSDTRILYLALLDLDHERWTQLAVFHVGSLIDTAIFPQIAPDLTLYDIRIRRNPVYDNWLLLKIELHSLEDPQTGGIDRSYLYYLWNYETGERIFFDDLFPDAQSEDGNFGWSDDGTLISYPTQASILRGDAINILQFDPQNDTVTLLKRADAGERIWISFLGVNDLMITKSYDYQTDSDPNTLQYTLSQFIDGTWYDRQFFQLEHPVGDFKFTLTADEAESHELSCLFDLALPTRLADSDSAITLSSLPVLEAPQPDAAIFTTLDPQTVIPLAGEKACTDYVRWQKVMLSDGTIGWVMEADQNHHYLEVK